MTDHPHGAESTDPHNPDLDVHLLDSTPSIPALFAKAVATSRGRPGAKGSLPQRRLMLTDVEQDVRRLADYAEVVGGTLADQLPATWLHVLTFPLQVHLMAAADFPLGLAGLVHVANSMTLHRPVGIDEEVTLSSSAADLRHHRSGTQVDLLGEARVGDEVVWTGRSTYLARGKRTSDSPRPTSDDAVGDQQNHSQNAWETDETATKIGEAPSALWRLPAGLGRDYAAVSGDVNPIHLSSVTAKAFGFPRAIAHGMWTHARALAALESRLPSAYEVEVDFRKPVLLPSTVGFGSLQGAGQTDFRVASRDGSRVHLTGSLRSLGASETPHRTT